MINFSIKIAILCIVSLIRESSASLFDRSRRPKCVPTPPPAPGPFQAIVNNAVRKMRAKGDCAAAKAYQQISNDICVGTVSRNPMFSINLNKPDPREFCQFLDITPLPSIMPKLGPNACRQMVECVASGIRAAGGKKVDIGKECVLDVFQGVLKDMEKQMSDWTNIFTGAARVSNELASSFVETVGCGQDPSKDASAAVRAIADMFTAMQNHKKDVAKNKMDVNLPKIFEMGRDEFFRGLGTRNRGEEGFISILFGPKISLNWKKLNVNTKYGIFVTVKVDEFIRHKSFSRLKIEEIGLYETYGRGKTNKRRKGKALGMSVGFEILHGTCKKWGGYSFGLTVGKSVPLYKKVDGRVELSLVFSAMTSRQHGGRQILNELIGFSVYPGVVLGKNNPGITKGLGCALAQVASVDPCAPKPPPRACPVNNLKGMRKRVHDTIKRMGQEWKSLASTCRKAWSRKWKRCTQTADNVGDAWRGCARGSRRKCVIYSSNYCKRGRWISATKRCKRFERKENGCASWDSVRKCTQHANKHHCWNQRIGRWFRIRYPCGWSGWRPRWCSKNVLRHAFKRMCKWVKDIGNCVRSVAVRTSCRVKKYVTNFANCVGGWIRTAARCGVATVAHCSRYAGACIKANAGQVEGMFKNCGVNMLPFVPA